MQSSIMTVRRNFVGVVMLKKMYPLFCQVSDLKRVFIQDVMFLHFWPNNKIVSCIILC